MHPAGLFCTNLKKAVDNSPFSWYNNTRRQERHRLWGISSAGRALAWHARGQRFDPAILHQKSTVLRRKYGAFLFAEADFWGCIASPAPFSGLCRQFLYNPQLLTLHRFQKGMFAARFLAGCCIIPFNVRRKVEVEGNVELIPTINIYSADKLIDDHFLCFKTGTVVQVSIGNQLIIQVPVVMRFFSSFSISSNCAIYALCCLRIFVVSTFT